MCECGCGEYTRMWRLAAPGTGRWYIFGPYEGCKPCGTPAGICIDLMDEIDLEDWGYSDLPQIGVTSPHFGIPLFDPAEFEKSLTRTLAEVCSSMRDELVEELVEKEDAAEAYEVIVEEVDVADLIRKNVWNTTQKFSQESSMPE